MDGSMGALKDGGWKNGEFDRSFMVGWMIR